MKIKHLFKYKILIFTLNILCASFLLTGCGKNEELELYKANMNQFFENITYFDTSINSIDPESEDAVTTLLDLLDSMNNTFAQMATLEVPEGFPGVDQLSDEASEYMNEAVNYYHQAFEGEEYDAILADVAKQNYDRANVRLQYIVSILHGNIPEEIYVSPEETGEDEFSEETGENEFTEETPVSE